MPVMLRVYWVFYIFVNFIKILPDGDNKSNLFAMVVVNATLFIRVIIYPT
jgi:hypothetical protein